eukprot:1179824-Prorocentrum_minimum.AAC.2
MARRISLPPKPPHPPLSVPEVRAERGGSGQAGRRRRRRRRPAERTVCVSWGHVHLAQCVHGAAVQHQQPDGHRRAGAQLRVGALRRAGPQHRVRGPRAQVSKCSLKNAIGFHSMDQSDAGSVGIFPRWTNQAQEAWVYSHECVRAVRCVCQS